MRGERTTDQIDKLVGEPHENRGSASSRPFTLTKSTDPSTIRPDYELSRSEERRVGKEC